MYFKGKVDCEQPFSCVSRRCRLPLGSYGATSLALKQNIKRQFEVGFVYFSCAYSTKYCHLRMKQIFDNRWFSAPLRFLVANV